MKWFSSYCNFYSKEKRESNNKKNLLDPKFLDEVVNFITFGCRLCRGSDASRLNHYSP